MAKRIQDVNEALSFSLAKSKALFPIDKGSSPIYIPRTELENQIKNINLNNNLRSCAYNVFYGPKGAGKSSLVARVLRDKIGVVLITVGQGDTTASIIRSLLDSCGVSYSKSMKLNDICVALKMVTEKIRDR